MSFLQKIKNKRQERNQRKQEKLRIKNDRLRSQGKEPLKGWNTVVNTGTGAFNTLVRREDKGGIDLTGKDTFNFYSEEQKKLAEKASKKHIND